MKELEPYLVAHYRELRESIEGGWYKPQPVRRVEIPKPDGGIRQLEVPTVIDRMVRKLCFRKQALVPVSQPVFEQTFSDSSYGFRPGRSARQAIERAIGFSVRRYYEEGYTWVVDLDLEKFADRRSDDTVNHDLLIKMVRETVADETIMPDQEVLKERYHGEWTGKSERDRTLVRGDAAGREPVAVVEQHIPDVGLLVRV